MPDVVNLIILIVPLLGLITVYVAGTMAEKKHYRSIEKREKEFLDLSAITLKQAGVDESNIEAAEMVCGNVVISAYSFKSYESLIDRARREAVLRMKAMAPGAAIIVNLRIETSSIGKSANRKRSVGSIEAIAYGTALTLKG